MRRRLLAYAAHQERVLQILRLAEEFGEDISFAEIGRRVGVSREAVRKVLRPRGYLLRKREGSREITCAQCDTVFKALPSRIKGGRRFCSRKCYGQSRRHPAVPRVELTCEVCEKTYVRKVDQIRRQRSRFCSKKCQGRRLAALRWWGRPPMPRVELTCEVCEETYTRRVSDIRRRRSRFCSKKCQGRWLAGLKRGVTKPEESILVGGDVTGE